MTVELNKDDIKTLIRLITEEIDRVGEAEEKYGLGDSGYFYHLVDRRNKLLAMPLDEEVAVSISDEEWQELFEGKASR